MSLLKELLTEGKRRGKHKVPPAITGDVNPNKGTNNFAAKHSVNKSGAGRHEDKHGQGASRERQKKNWKKEINKEID